MNGKHQPQIVATTVHATKEIPRKANGLKPRACLFGGIPIREHNTDVWFLRAAMPAEVHFEALGEV